MPELANTTNREHDWHDFNTGMYSSQYKELIPEDLRLARFCIGALLESGVSLKSLKTGVDIGNCGVARGPALIAPFIRDDGEITWGDIGESQLMAARETIQRGRRGDLGIWALHQTHMGEIHPAWSGAMFRACHLGRAARVDALELPEGKWDISSALFVQESITANRDEWEFASRAFYRSVRRGHPIVQLFMRGSRGYTSAGTPKPAVDIDEIDVRNIAQAELRGIQTYTVEASHMARPKDEDAGLFGYKGMGALVGIRK